MRFFILILFIGITGGQKIAHGYSTVIAFGDSLTATGPQPFGSLTDPGAPMWIELLADELGATLENHAVAGATTGFDNPALTSDMFGLQWQIQQATDAVNPNGFTSDTLLSVWAGANDFLQGRDSTTGVGNIETALNTLYDAGGRDFLIPNLPDIGNSKRFQDMGAPYSQAASLWSFNFNAQLLAVATDFRTHHSDSTLYFVDIFSKFASFPVGSDEWLNLFWEADGFHPSQIGHRVIYETALAEVAPVPEPSAAIIFLTGIIAICHCRKKRRYT